MPAAGAAMSSFKAAARMGTARDRQALRQEAIARLAQALEVPAELLDLPPTKLGYEIDEAEVRATTVLFSLRQLATEPEQRTWEALYGPFPDDAVIDWS